MWGKRNTCNDIIRILKREVYCEEKEVIRLLIHLVKSGFVKKRTHCDPGPFTAASNIFTIIMYVKQAGKHIPTVTIQLKHEQVRPDLTEGQLAKVNVSLLS